MPVNLDWKRERRWLTSFGLALAAAGFVRYSTQGEWTRLSEILLIGGGVLFLAGLVLSYREIVAFFSVRSSQLGANALIGIRYDATELAAGITEVLCYGTAVFVERQN